MIYAKCIRESQLAHSHEEFVKRHNEEHHVYCIGETTLAREHDGDLYCVPLSFTGDSAAQFVPDPAETIVFLPRFLLQTIHFSIE